MNHNAAPREGGAGSTIAFICRLLLFAAPLAVLQLDLIISIFLLIIMMFVPLWGEVLRAILYVWAFSLAIEHPADSISLIFFACAGLYLIQYVVILVRRYAKTDKK